MKYDTLQTTEITCPYCGYEFSDSWEYNYALEDDTQVVECHSCDQQFNVTMNISITYDTYKITCEDDKHEYEHVSYHKRDKKYINSMTWEDLPEHLHKFYKIEECKICNEQNFIEISKDEYLSK